MTVDQAEARRRGNAIRRWMVLAGVILLGLFWVWLSLIIEGGCEGDCDEPRFTALQWISAVGAVALVGSDVAVIRRHRHLAAVFLAIALSLFAAWIVVLSD